MNLIWKYLRPHKKLILLSLFLAGAAQLLNLIDPVIFGKIIDQYASGKNNQPENQQIRGVIFWLLLAWNRFAFKTSESAAGLFYT